MPSFDVVMEPDWVEIRNAVDQAKKDIGTRFDFKGSSAGVELASTSGKPKEMALLADSDFQLEQVRDVLLARLSKRQVDVRFLDLTFKPQKLGGDKLKQAVPIQAGLDAEAGKRVQQVIKAAKLKVQAAIQGDAVRVTGTKRDDLQAAMALLRKELHDLPIGFDNLRA